MATRKNVAASVSERIPARGTARSAKAPLPPEDRLADDWLAYESYARAASCRWLLPGELVVSPAQIFIFRKNFPRFARNQRVKGSKDKG